VRAFLTWAEATAIGHFMRESGPWTYAWVNVVHVLAVAALFGSVLVVDLRLLGFGRRLSLSSIAAAATPITAAAVCVALASGWMLLTTKATAYNDNPFLLIKLPVVALALVNASLIRLSSAWRASRTRELLPPERRQLAVMAAISLSCWLTAIVCGRMIGYW
jgi:hypothetical protein